MSGSDPKPSDRLYVSAKLLEEDPTYVLDILERFSAGGSPDEWIRVFNVDRDNVAETALQLLAAEPHGTTALARETRFGLVQLLFLAQALAPATVAHFVWRSVSSAGAVLPLHRHLSHSLVGNDISTCQSVALTGASSGARAQVSLHTLNWEEQFVRMQLVGALVSHAHKTPTNPFARVGLKPETSLEYWTRWTRLAACSLCSLAGVLHLAAWWQTSLRKVCTAPGTGGLVSLTVPDQSDMTGKSALLEVTSQVAEELHKVTCQFDDWVCAVQSSTQLESKESPPLSMPTCGELLVAWGLWGHEVTPSVESVTARNSRCSCRSCKQKEHEGKVSHNWEALPLAVLSRFKETEGLGKLLVGQQRKLSASCKSAGCGLCAAALHTHWAFNFLGELAVTQMRARNESNQLVVGQRHLRTFRALCRLYKLCADQLSGRAVCRGFRCVPLEQSKKQTANPLANDDYEDASDSEASDSDESENGSGGEGGESKKQQVSVFGQACLALASGSDSSGSSSQPSCRTASVRVPRLLLRVAECVVTEAHRLFTGMVSAYDRMLDTQQDIIMIEVLQLCDAVSAYLLATLEVTVSAEEFAKGAGWCVEEAMWRCARYEQGFSEMRICGLQSAIKTLRAIEECVQRALITQRHSTGPTKKLCSQIHRNCDLIGRLAPSLLVGETLQRIAKETANLPDIARHKRACMCDDIVASEEQAVKPSMHTADTQKPGSPDQAGADLEIDDNTEVTSSSLNVFVGRPDQSEESQGATVVEPKAPRKTALEVLRADEEGNEGNDISPQAPDNANDSTVTTITTVTSSTLPKPSDNAPSQSVEAKQKANSTLIQQRKRRGGRRFSVMTQKPNMKVTTPLSKMVVRLLQLVPFRKQHMKLIKHVLVAVKVGLVSVGQDNVSSDELRPLALVDKSGALVPPTTLSLASAVSREEVQSVKPVMQRKGLIASIRQKGAQNAQEKSLLTVHTFLVSMYWRCRYLLLVMMGQLDELPWCGSGPGYLQDFGKPGLARDVDARDAGRDDWHVLFTTQRFFMLRCLGMLYVSPVISQYELPPESMAVLLSLRELCERVFLMLQSLFPCLLPAIYGFPHSLTPSLTHPAGFTPGSEWTAPDFAKSLCQLSVLDRIALQASRSIYVYRREIKELNEAPDTHWDRWSDEEEEDVSSEEEPVTEEFARQQSVLRKNSPFAVTPGRKDLKLAPTLDALCVRLNLLNQFLNYLAICTAKPQKIFHLPSIRFSMNPALAARLCRDLLYIAVETNESRVLALCTRALLAVNAVEAAVVPPCIGQGSIISHSSSPDSSSDDESDEERKSNIRDQPIIADWLRSLSDTTELAVEIDDGLYTDDSPLAGAERHPMHSTLLFLLCQKEHRKALSPDFARHILQVFNHPESFVDRSNAALFLCQILVADTVGRQTSTASKHTQSSAGTLLEVVKSLPEGPIRIDEMLAWNSDGDDYYVQSRDCSVDWGPRVLVGALEESHEESKGRRTDTIEPREIFSSMVLTTDVRVTVEIAVRVLGDLEVETLVGRMMTSVTLVLLDELITYQVVEGEQSEQDFSQNTGVDQQQEITIHLGSNLKSLLLEKRENLEEFAQKETLRQGRLRHENKYLEGEDEMKLIRTLAIKAGPARLDDLTTLRSSMQFTVARTLTLVDALYMRLVDLGVE